MKRFDYVRPGTLREALALLEEYGPEARALAGGTDVIVRLREGRNPPKMVVDLKRVRDLSGGIAETVDGFRIGACVTMTEILANARLAARFPALAEAAAVVGSVQIRNRATLAGNVCNASPAADTAPALLVYGAVVNVIGKAGARRIPLDEFFLGPGRTALGRGELVESIDLPLKAGIRGATFGRITRRYGVDLATVTMACLVTESGEVRFGYGAVAPRPFLVRESLAGDREAMLARAVSQAAPISDVRGSREYRQAMLLATSRRCLERAL